MDTHLLYMCKLVRLNGSSFDSVELTMPLLQFEHLSGFSSLLNYVPKNKFIIEWYARSLKQIMAAMVH